MRYPDWPKPGITFADFSPVYADPGLRQELTAHFSNIVANEGIEIEALRGRESLPGIEVRSLLQI